LRTTAAEVLLAKTNWCEKRQKSPVANRHHMCIGFNTSASHYGSAFPSRDWKKSQAAVISTRPHSSETNHMSSPSLSSWLRATATGVLATLASLTGLSAADTVKIGVLHSLSGTMAISEISCKDATLLAVKEINAAGGVLGKKIEPVVVDPNSNWDLFAEKAKQLVLQDKVAVTFGCWTSVSRKSVLPVYEQNNALLFYPVQYEGEEQSLNVFYTAASPNQQLIPAAEYLMSEEGGKYKKFYLLGTDYVFPRTANKVLKAFLKSKGVPDANIMEDYTDFGHKDYQTIVGKIKAFAAGGGACVLSTINGDSNVPFYKEFANQGLTAADCPIMAFSVAEDELRAMDVPPLVGHLAAWNYFQSIDTPENKKFVEAFKKEYGQDRVTDDPIEAAYYGVYIWKKAVEKAGTFNVDDVRMATYDLEFDSPSGKKKMDLPQSTHL
jgi:urea transport system substrate-binding protein